MPGKRLLAAQAGKHFVLEKPTGLDQAELIRIRDAVRASGVRTIVSFELRFHPYLKFVHWFRSSGFLGELRFARTQYLSNVTDWYRGWDWVKTTRGGPQPPAGGGVPCRRCPALVLGQGSGRGQRLPYPLHRGLRMADVDPRQRPDGVGALGHVTSSTDFMLPVQLSGRADGRSVDDSPGSHPGPRRDARYRGAARGEPVCRRDTHPCS